MLCCPLSSYDDGDGSAECYDQRIVTAKKLHKCTECGEDIPSGSRYEYTKGLWEGSWSVFKTCLSCREIRDHFACDGYLFGQLWSDLADNFFPDMKAGGPCMEGLSPEAKGRLFDLRMKWLEDSA